jgi:hypothetical protein
MPSFGPKARPTTPVGLVSSSVLTPFRKPDRAAGTSFRQPYWQGGQGQCQHVSGVPMNATRSVCYVNYRLNHGISV